MAEKNISTLMFRFNLVDGRSSPVKMGFPRMRLLCIPHQTHFNLHLKAIILISLQLYWLKFIYSSVVQLITLLITVVVRRYVACWELLHMSK